MKEKIPAVVGVPLITPVEMFNVSPPGRLPEATANMYGEAPPVTVIGDEYARPTVPVLAAAH